MTCPHCIDANDVFGKRFAESDLRDYYKKGPAKMTQVLINTVRELGVQGASLLDIGGGVGVIQHELMEAGLGKSTDVDASSAYLQVAQAEATKRGYADRADYHYGDFVQLAGQIDDADIVTLDRAICCYPDVDAFVTASAQKARRIYAVVFPRDTLLTRLGAPLLNLSFRFNRSAFRVFIHNGKRIDNLITAQGLRKHTQKRGLFWQAVVYIR